jgi:hypothetical protein
VTNLFDSLVQETEPAEPAAPRAPETKLGVFDQIIADDAASQESELRASLLSSRETAPQQAAQALDLGKRTGLPPEEVLTDHKRIADDLQFDEALADLKAAPNLSGEMARNPLLAAAARHDIKALSQFEQVARSPLDVVGDVATAGGRFLGVLGKGVAFETLPRVGETLLGAGAAALDQIDSVTGGSGIEAAVAEAQGRAAQPSAYGMAAKFLRDRAQASRDTREWWREQQGLDTVLEQGVYGGVTSAASSLLTMGAGGALGATLGTKAALSALLGGMEPFIAQVDEERLKGRSITEATARATPTLLLNAGLEYLPDRLFFDALKGGFTPANIAKQTSVEVGSELLTFVGEQVDAVLQGRQDLQQTIDAAPRGALVTAIASLVGSAVQIGGGQAFRVATKRVDQQIAHLVDSETANARVQGLMDAVANVGLRDTNPEAFSDLIGKLTSNSGFAQVYIDASDLTEALAEAGHSIGELGTVFPSLRGREGDILAGDEISIPMPELLIAAKDARLDAALRPRLRGMAGGLSVQEVDEANRLAGEFMADAGAEIETELAAAVELETDAQTVRQQVLETLTEAAAGRFGEEETGLMAALVGEMYKTTAQRMGVKPSDLIFQFPYKVQSLDQILPFSTEEAPSGAYIESFPQGKGRALSGAEPAQGAMPPLRVTHFSNTPGLTTLSGDAFGTGYRSEELNRVKGAKDARQKRRVYFYAGDARSNKAKWNPGGHAYETTLGNIYDATNDPLGLAAKVRAQGLRGEAFATAFESAVLDAGFDGYLNRNHPEGVGGVVLNQDVPVEYVGRVADLPDAGQTAPFVPGQPATVEDFSDPARLGRVLERTNWAILTAANPNAKPLGWRENDARNKALVADIKAIPGAQVMQAEGHYGTPEPSLVVLGITEAQAAALGAKYEQESVLTPRGLVFGDGRVVPARGVRTFDGPPRDGDYTTVFPPRGRSVSFSVDLDFSGFAQGSTAAGVYVPGDQTIYLMANADFSTIVHETGHRFLDMFSQLAADPNAPDDIRADMDALLKLFKVPDVRTWNSMSLNEQRDGHEKFAEMFELYMFNGDAPTEALRPVFARFREFLVSTMPHARAMLAQHGADFRPEVIAVFDRLVAAQEEISAQSRSLTPPVFGSAEEMGVTQEQWLAFQQLLRDANDEALAYLGQRSLRDLKWVFNSFDKHMRGQRREINSQRTEALGEASREAREVRALNVRRWLSTGVAADGRQETGAKLFTGELREIFGESPAAPWRYLPATVLSNEQDGTLPADVVAEMFGYGTESGEAMVRDMVATGDEQSWIDTRAKEILLERYGETRTKDAMREAAIAALHNEVRARAVATELEVMSRANRVTRKTARGGRVNIILEAAKRFARNRVNATKVRDLSPAQETAAAKRAGDAVPKALRDGNNKEAIRHKRNQLLHEVTAREASAAKEDVRRMLTAMRKLGRRKTSKSIDQGYLDRIKDLLSSVSLADTSGAQAARREALRAWVAQQTEAGSPPLLNDRLMDSLGRVPYQDMTVGDIRELYDTVMNMAHLGRLKRRLLVAKDKREFDALSGAIAQNIRDNAVVHTQQKVDAPTALDKARKGLRSFLASHRTIASIVHQLDGLKSDGGPLWEALVRPMNERSAWGHERLRKEGSRLRAVLEPVFGGRAARRKVEVPALGKGQRLSLESRIVTALNYGNLANRQRLLDGNKWTDVQARAVMGTLTATELNTVNQVWGYLDTFWPEIEAQYKRLTGVAPTRVDPAPFTVTSSDGVEVEMRGGYYPIAYDLDRAGSPAEESPKDAAARLLAGGPARAMTSHGFTEQRATEVAGAALRMDIQPLFRHVQEVVHDLTWHEWLVDATRLLDSRGQVAEAIRSTMGPEALRELRDARVDIAQSAPAVEGWADHALTWLRQGVTISALGLNMSTVLLQPVGATQAMQFIGPKWFGVGMAQWLGTPAHMLRTAQQISELSPMMRNRADTFHAGISEATDLLRPQGKAARVLTAASFYPIAAAQKSVDIPLWLGAYAKAMKQTGGDSAKSVALADQAVISSQGGGSTEMVASIMRGNGFKRIFTNFMSFVNATHNLSAEAWHRTNFKSPGDVAKFIGDMTLLVWAPAAMTGLLLSSLRAGEPPEDAEDALTTYGLEVLRYHTGGLFLVRDVVGAATSMTGYSGPAGVRGIDSFGRFAKGVAAGDFDEEHVVRAGAATAGVLFHLPTGQLDRTIRGYLAMSNGEDVPPTSLLFGPPPQ